MCERTQRTNEAIAGSGARLVEEETEGICLRHRDIFLPAPLGQGQVSVCKPLPVRFDKRLPVARGDERHVARVTFFAGEGEERPEEFGAALTNRPPNAGIDLTLNQKANEVVKAEVPKCR